MYNRKAAGEIFRRYAEQYDMQNTLIRHKVEHTFRVAELCGRYAEALAMAGEDTDLAWLIGLMHDIGRFEQARRGPLSAGRITGGLAEHRGNSRTAAQQTETGGNTR